MHLLYENTCSEGHSLYSVSHLLLCAFIDFLIVFDFSEICE